MSQPKPEIKTEESATETEQWVGEDVPPKSGKRYVAGRGEYLDDIQLEGMLHCRILRSPEAHAEIKSIDVSDALAHPDVEAVITGEDAEEMMNPLPANLDMSDFGDFRTPEAYSFAVDRVRYVGEPIAAVAASDPYTAEDALELISVEYESLPAVVDGKEAMDDDAPVLYPEWGDNVQWHYEDSFGDVDESFEKADHVISEELYEHRYSGFPLEPRGTIAHFKAKDDLTMWQSTQSPHLGRRFISGALGMRESDITINAPDVGGAFGNKLNWATDIIPCLLSIETERPVKWIEDKESNIKASPHARDYYFDVSVACDSDGTINGVDVHIVWNCGVEASNRGTGLGQPLVGLYYAPGPYKVDSLRVEGHGMVTNTSFSCAYRGYGKEVGNRILERMIDIMARRLDLDPVEIRRRNFIQPDEFPFQQLTGPVYDSGDYPELLDKALKAADYEEFQEELESAEQDDETYRGVGVAAMVEPAGAAVPSFQYAGFESATVKIPPGGGVNLMTPNTNIGQSSDTYLAQIVADELGVSPDDVNVVDGDSDKTPMGAGPWSSRGAVWSASAVANAASEMREKLFQIASHLLEVDEDDLEITEGVIHPSGAEENGITIEDLAEQFYFFPGPQFTAPNELLEDGDSTLEVTESWFSPLTAEDPMALYTTHPSAVNVVTVEVDGETGEIEVLDYVWSHDCGVAINPRSVEGQVHGGTIQGIGGTIYEELSYTEDGQLPNSTYEDYLLPTAHEMPNMEIEHIECPSPYTELGTKGAGESGAIIAPSVIINAVEDALQPIGDITIEKTPLRPDYIKSLIDEQR